MTNLAPHQIDVLLDGFRRLLDSYRPANPDDAVNPADAERQAIDLIRQDSKLRRSVKHSPANPPLMFTVDIAEVDRFAPLKPPGTGYLFFHGRGAGRPRTGRRS